MYDLCIKNGLIVNSEASYKGNIYIKDEKIAAITDENDIYDAKHFIDASGKLVMPGFIDSHSHLNDPGMTESEDFYTGTCSAAAGGITTVLEHPLTVPLPAVLEALQDKKEIVEKKAVIDFCLFGACAPENYEEVQKMIDMGAVGFKAFIPYSPEIPQLDDGQMMKHMKFFAGKDVVLGIHCENDKLVSTFTRNLESAGMVEPKHYGKSRPEIAEVEAVNRMALFAKESGAKVHVVHCSTGEAVDIVNFFKRNGTDITVETCPHFLFLNEADVEEWGVYGICNPPIRSKETVEKLWERVLNGSVDFIGSDHATYTFDEKELGRKNVFQTPAGVSGIQTCFPLFFDGAVNKRGMAPERFVRMSSRATAERYGIYPQKGILQVGTDADIVLFDPDKEWVVKEENLFYKQKWTPYMNMTIRGSVEATIVRGSIVYQEGQIVIGAGHGKFIAPSRNKSNGDVLE